MYNFTVVLSSVLSFGELVIWDNMANNFFSESFRVLNDFGVGGIDGGDEFGYFREGGIVREDEGAGGEGEDEGEGPEGRVKDAGDVSDDSSDVDITDIGGIRDDRFEDGGPGEAFDAGLEWARGEGHPITGMPFVQEIGCRHILAENATDLHFFFLFFDVSFFDELVTETNRYAEQTRAQAASVGRPHKTVWHVTDVAEIFIAMQIMFGVKPVKDMNLMWSSIPWTSYPWYSSIMTRNRHWVLSRYFHVRDTSDTPLRVAAQTMIPCSR